MSVLDWFVLVGSCLFIFILVGIAGAVAALIELQEVSEGELITSRSRVSHERKR